MQNKKGRQLLTSFFVPRIGVEPIRPLLATGFSYHFDFYRSHLGFVVWTIPSPYSVILKTGALRLVSTPFGSFTLTNLARDYHTVSNEGFPEFEGFCTKGFPMGTQIFLFFALKVSVWLWQFGHKSSKLCNK